MKPGDLVIINLKLKCAIKSTSCAEDLRDAVVSHLIELSVSVARCKKPTLKKLITLLGEYK
jgi:hypothetical protein